MLHSVINKYGDLMFMFFVPTRQTVIWLVVNGLTSHFMSYACKGYKTTPENKTFSADMKQKVCVKASGKLMISIYATCWRSIMTLKCCVLFFRFLTFHKQNRAFTQSGTGTWNSSVC